MGTKRRTYTQTALVFIPRGTVHAVRVPGDAARALNLHTPAGFERGVVTLGGPALDRTLPPSSWTPPAIPEGCRDLLFTDLGVRWLAVPDPHQPGIGTIAHGGGGA